MNEVKNIPRLRFPEFKEQWLNYSFNNVSTFFNGRAYKQNELLDKGKYPVLRVGNLFTNNNWYYSDLELDENKYIDNEDLIYAWSASFGPRIWYGDKVIYHYHIWKVEIDNSIINKRFYFQVLENETIKMKTSSSNGFALLHITKGTIENWKSFFPSLPEQQKIADFLTSVDKRIELLEKKKTLLETYKKGVMKKIFNQEIRFKDDNGNDFPDWEEKRLGEICKLQGGYAFKSNSFKDTGIPIIRISNISNDNNYLNLENLVHYEEISNEENFTVLKGDLLIAMSGATTGKTSISNYDGKCYLNQRVGLFKSKTDKLNYSYLVQFVYSPMFGSQLVRFLVAGAQPNISSKDIESVRIPFPLTIEQQKISKFLSSIDTQLKLIETQIDKSKTWKKGLLQKMFV
jgi:type I restriction enzyme, S subunit